MNPDYFRIMHKAAVAQFQPHKFSRDPLSLTDSAVHQVYQLGREFREALERTASPHRHVQLLERVRECLNEFARVEEDILKLMDDQRSAS